MRLFLTVAVVMAACSSLALAQGVPSPGFGEPGTMSAMMRFGGMMLVEPVFLVFLIVVLLIASRFFYWMLIPAGGAIAAVAAAMSHTFSGVYGGHAINTGPFWAAAVFLGMGIGLVTILVLRMFGKQE
jgi:hypothetical protein